MFMFKKNTLTGFSFIMFSARLRLGKGIFFLILQNHFFLYISAFLDVHRLTHRPFFPSISLLARLRVIPPFREVRRASQPKLVKKN